MGRRGVLLAGMGGALLILAGAGLWLVSDSEAAAAENARAMAALTGAPSTPSDDPAIRRAIVREYGGDEDMVNKICSPMTVRSGVEYPGVALADCSGVQFLVRDGRVAALQVGIAQTN